jgi:hypothetical protein
MSTSFKSNRAKRGLAAALCLTISQCVFAVNGVEPTDNIVLQWNSATLEAIRVTHPGPPIVARMLAVVNTCTFDAWAAFDAKARDTRFGTKLKAKSVLRNEAAKEEAIAYAAYRANLDLFPGADEQAYFAALMSEQGFDPNNDSTDKNTAAGIGNRACAAVLEFRHSDGSNQLGDINGGAPYSDYTGYTPVNTPDDIIDPNRWQPLRVSDGHGGFVVQKFIAPHWGLVEPFAIRDWDKKVISPVRKDFKKRNGRVGPASVDQPEYKLQADEVISYSATLVDQQKVIAEYWADGPSSELPPGHWNLFARFVSLRDGHSIDDDVKMNFAMANTVFDTSIAIWGAKVQFDSVRPVTAIHYLYAGEEINAWAGPGLGTAPIMGEQWRPYQATVVVSPPFGEYPSGHSAFSSSAAEILKRYTGSDVFGATIHFAPDTSFVEANVPAADLFLSYATFTDASDEAGISRRYGGIHFLDGDLEARVMGRRVAELVWPVIQYHFGAKSDKKGRGHKDKHKHKRRRLIRLSRL